MVEECAYLFLGDDDAAKKNKIDAIKERCLDESLKDMDSAVVYADDRSLTPQKFDEVLSYPPASKSQKRVVVVKNLESLKQENKEVLLKRLKNPSKSVVYLLDASSRADEFFLKELGRFVKRIDVATKEKVDAFNLAEAIINHRTNSAVGILNRLLQGKENPQVILGALLWQWDKAKDRLSLEQFRK